MSLKAKIEAVIYASEEPVTLAQLIGLLGHEAQAELDRIEAAQQSLDLEEAPAAAAALNDENFAEPGGSDEEVAVSSPLSEATPTVPDAEPETAPAGDAAEEPAVSTSEPAGDAPAEAAPDDKKAAREKERRLRDYFRAMLDQLIGDYANGDRGLEIREVASGYRLATKPEYHDAVRGFVKSLKPPLKLSLQALETLAVVAYKQPVTAPEISEIRGVDSGGVLGSLMARKLVTTAGRKQVIGRPILYKTTRDFLLRFGLKDIGELPSIEEFEKMAGELAEQEEIPMDSVDSVEHHAPETAEELQPGKHIHIAQADGSPDGEDDPLDVALEDEPEETEFEDARTAPDKEKAAPDGSEDIAESSEV